MDEKEETLFKELKDLSERGYDVTIKSSHCDWTNAGFPFCILVYNTRNDKNIYRVLRLEDISCENIIKCVKELIEEVN